MPDQIPPEPKDLDPGTVDGQHTKNPPSPNPTPSPTPTPTPKG